MKWHRIAARGLPLTRYELDRRAFLRLAGSTIRVADWRTETRQSYLSLEFSL
jgi:hypothetical protein